MLKYIASTVASICITAVLLFSIEQKADPALIIAGITILGGLGGFTAYSLTKINGDANKK